MFALDVTDEYVDVNEAIGIHTKPYKATAATIEIAKISSNKMIT